MHEIVFTPSRQGVGHDLARGAHGGGQWQEHLRPLRGLDLDA
jgi:hypothetical protein